VVLQIFTQRVWEGEYDSQGNQVQTDSIQTALGAIGKTIELAGLPNLLYIASTTNYIRVHDYANRT